MCTGSVVLIKVTVAQMQQRNVLVEVDGESPDGPGIVVVVQEMRCFVGIEYVDDAWMTTGWRFRAVLCLPICWESFSTSSSHRCLALTKSTGTFYFRCSAKSTKPFREC